MNLEPLLPDKVYHIYNHANGSENLFRSDKNYRYFLAKYAQYIYPVVDTYAYCLMPNHFHLMVRIRSEEELLEYLKIKKSRKDLEPPLQGFQTLEEVSLSISRQFSHFFNAYTQAYNKMYNRKGSLFIPRFKRKLVQDENYFTRLIAYIHLNPVKDGFCKNMLDWEHSSIHAYCHEKTTKVNRMYLEEWFGNKQALLDFHSNIKINDSLFEF